MDPRVNIILIVAAYFVPAILVAWHAKRNGRAWLLWFFLISAWPLLRGLSPFFSGAPSDNLLLISISPSSN